MNEIPLIGETHKEVVSILKDLPLHVCLVCSRISPPSIADSDEEDEDDVHLTLKELLAEFNDKVKAHTEERMNGGIKPHWKFYSSSFEMTVLFFSY